MRPGKNFRDTSFDHRKHISENIKNRYPDRSPVILESEDVELLQYKYLAPDDITVGKFLFEIRKHSTLGKETAMFIFIITHNGGKILPNQTSLISSVHRSYKHEDGFLYMQVTLENTFGGEGNSKLKQAFV